MCVCIQCFWEWLIQHLKKKPIIRYEQVPFDIDDHIEEDYVQETTRFLTPDTDCDCDEKTNVGTKRVLVEEKAVELTSQSLMPLTPDVTAESTDNETDSSSDECDRMPSNKHCIEQRCITRDVKNNFIDP